MGKTILGWWFRLYHPPNGSEGLNLAFSDVNYLSKAHIAFYARERDG